MNLQDFKEKALTRFTREITDIFFCYIENDEELLQDYQRIIGREGDLDTTNKKLGEAVKSWFRLENDNENRDPKSKLIRSYTKHIRK
jgi:hypothetical protein